MEIETADGIHGHMFRITVIYLHCNSLKSAGKLSFSTNLTHLYLQWNKITSLSDLNGLKNLTNLYLGHNCIDTLGGLDGMPKLKVLHLENQKLPLNALHFSFEKQTLARLSQSLAELNVSGNSISSLSEVQLLAEIAYLDVSNNLIFDINDTCKTIRKLKNLKSLQIEKNPITKNKTYMYDIIASSKALAKINNREISSTNRFFMQTLRKVKIQQKRHNRNNKKLEFSSETKSFVNQLPLEFRDTVSGCAIRGDQ